MTREDQNKILDAKIESNVNQYKIDRLNAEISGFSSGDLNKYKFLKRTDLNYKPNALDKARFEFSPLGKAFSTGLDKNIQGYQEEGIIKLLKDIRDSLAGNVIIPARPPRPNDNGDDNEDDNGDDEMSIIDLSWINNLQLYEKIASEVFSRYNGNKDSFELFTLQTFIDNINNERIKNKKDAREEFKTVKKNIKSEALKQIFKELEQAIFGYDNDKDKKELEEELERAEVLDKKFKNLIGKKRLQSFKECSKKAEYIDPQIRVKALRKKLNNLPKTSDKTSDDNNNNNDNDDSEDNQISNFVDRVLKKVSKEIVNDDNKNDNKKLLKLSEENADVKKKSNQKSKENTIEQIKKVKASENLFNKQIVDAKEFLKLVEKKEN